MDILAHALWASAGITAAQRRWPIAPRTAAATVALAVMPDLGHMLPMLAWGLLGEGSITELWRYAFALPGQEPTVPPTVAMVSHHLHCILHSAIVAGGVTLLAWSGLRQLWIPLLGWWSHIVIDIFTHSADFYPAPVLYPITQQGFDGIAWNTPWFMVLNYTALATTALWLWRTPGPRHS
jgi:LexA-binding, inner membrane-associated putative hydrolase